MIAVENPIYLIKKLGPQELGSQSERGGDCHRGRYLLISKQPEIQRLFPALSEFELNASALITLKPIWEGSSGVRQYCNYVYHNSKFASSQANGRNEFRIYFPKDLEEKQFFKNDIIILRRDDRAWSEQEGAPTFDYLLDWIRADSDDYDLYKSLFKKQLGRAENYCLHVGCLPDFERRASQVARESGISFAPEIGKRIWNLQKGGVAEKEVPTVPSTSDDSDERIFLSPTEQLVASQFNSSIFHDVVLANYQQTCAVTGEVISYGAWNNLEAAHIHPRCHGGNFLPSNGIAMRRDIHWAFDKGMFYIDENLRVVVAEEVKDSYLYKYNGVEIHPVMKEFRPNPQFLKYHQKHVYKLFLTTGALRPVPS